MGEEALYLKDCYLKEFDATVTKVDKDKYVVLDKTAFYGKAGGQPHDTGKFVCDGTEYKIVYVGKFGGKISHEVDKPGLKIGDKVHGIIDWERRYKFMRYHTASHVLSRVIFDDTGAHTSGNQIALDYTRIDFTLENFDREKIPEWFKRSNQIIKENREVKCTLMPREEAFKIPDLIRTAKNLLPETVKIIRVVDIKDLDVQACGGTHLKSLGEIKGIEFVKAENKGKNNRRIYFKLID